MEKEKKCEDLALFQFCMAKPTIYDVMVGSKKIAGSAQRKRKQGFLHQGSITLCLPKAKLLEEVLLPNTNVLSSMQENTLALIEDSCYEIEKAKESIKTELKKIFS